MTSVVEFLGRESTGVRFLQKNRKNKNNSFILTFTDVHMGRQKMPKSDFQSQFSQSKIVRTFLNLIFIEEYQFRSRFFVIVIF